MQICYIWTERYKNLINFGLNLSSDYEFNFDGYQITATTKPNITSKLYGDKISNISALVGINGSGKTTALELICRCLKDPTSLSNHWFVIYESDGELFLSTNLAYELSIPEFINIDPLHSETDKCRVIFYSNVFDGNLLALPETVHDLSVNNKNDAKLNFVRRGKEFESDIEKQIRFIKSDAFQDLKLTPPVGIEFKISAFPGIKLRERVKQTKTNSYGKQSGYQIEDILLKFIDIIQNERSNHRADKQAFVINFLMKHLFIEDFMAHLDKESPFFWKVIDSLREETWEDSDSILKIIARHADDLQPDNPYSNNYSLTSTIHFLLNISALISYADIEMDVSAKAAKTVFFMPLNGQNSNTLLIMTGLFNRCTGCYTRWVGQSSGEKAYLDLYSAIWASIDQEIEQKIDGTLLCIDEPDLYLHPQWQVQFLGKLIETLPYLTENKIQIILTTHSPLLLSDIPKQCISIMGHNTENTPQVPNTFGANLYDLYAKVFGIGYQSMGSIARTYISKILTLIDADEVSEQDISILHQALDIIGDEIILYHIKEKLKKMHDIFQDGEA